MHYPSLKTLPAKRERVAAFGGLNRQPEIGPGEFSQMENFTADSFPLAATCRGSGPVFSPCPQGVLAKEELCYVAGRRLYVGEQSYDLGLTDGEKQMISMGAYVLILPDRAYLNTADPQDRGTVEEMPDMDLLFESGNRLWGCRYGLQNGAFVNEIYASGLGDFRCWKSFQGVSTDSYIASVGSDGPFTGGMDYLGTPLFFKENCLHRVHGGYPGEYRVQTVPCQGVAPGCGKSLCLLGDTALYLGKNGVCAYDGAMPRPIARELGPVSGPACAGVLADMYYLSTPQGLYGYHSHRKLWHRQSPVAADCLLAWQGALVYPDREKNALMALHTGPAQVDFSLTTGWIAGRELLGLSLDYALRGWATVEAQYDHQSHWQSLGCLPETAMALGRFPLRPRPCVCLRLRLRGRGELRLHSLEKTLKRGNLTF